MNYIFLSGFVPACRSEYQPEQRQQACFWPFKYPTRLAKQKVRTQLVFALQGCYAKQHLRFEIKSK